MTRAGIPAVRESRASEEAKYSQCPSGLSKRKRKKQEHKMEDLYYCDNDAENCNWKGRAYELISFEIGIRQYCPKCGKPDSICDMDAVGSDDYKKQERR